jgi:hypothetical protein
VFFSLPTWALALVIFGVVVLACVFGAVLAQLQLGREEKLREPLGIIQGAILGVVGLVLAFGLTLAIDRYEKRRDAVVDASNAIETTYLRAQMLHEPQRTQSLALLRQYGTLALQISSEIPASDAMDETTAAQDELQRPLWRLAGQAVARSPQDTAPRLYIESLNLMIDQRTARVASLENRIPSDVLALELIGSAIALALLTLYLEMLGRGRVPIALAVVLVGALLFVTFDLDRPTRGLINVPKAPLQALQHELAQPPAAAAP